MHFIKMLFVLALCAVVSVGVIHADDVEGVALLPDGRVNNWQIDAPIAIYCVFTQPSDDSSTFERIEVWGLNSNKLLEASAAQINAASGTEVLEAVGEYTLAQLANDSFQISVSNSYTITWERGDTNC